VAVVELLQFCVTHNDADEHEHGIEAGTGASDDNAHLFHACHADGLGADNLDGDLQDVQDGYNREQDEIVVEDMGEIDVETTEQAEEYQE